uniref:Uncharacterized protein n=1 Tax=Chromera velia CCMP2878 TaxID=1169474 RepID=A0A0G4G1V7_9ALVE|eukprot:Cvel_4062.t1-p1 / transcript=Cvel_4062.t1 / gene=Cvel_4062 / organism=Chromera_velia_CCMP2878 / gene_product=hypothetical protein / transcript_product=hypothetical protein / location=Cvel_scaffold173:25184-26984(+) / protein_length=276 / sequence_SO=supercontig / SO=protein_coding / is_pseudo=false
MEEGAPAEVPATLSREERVARGRRFLDNFRLRKSLGFLPKSLELPSEDRAALIKRLNDLDEHRRKTGGGVLSLNKGAGQGDGVDGTLTGVGAGALEKKAELLQKTVTEYKSKVRELTSKVEKLKNEREEAWLKLSASQKRVDLLEKTVDSKQASIVTILSDNEVLSKQVEDQKKEISELTQACQRMQQEIERRKRTTMAAAQPGEVLQSVFGGASSSPAVTPEGSSLPPSKLEGDAQTAAAAAATAKLSLFQQQVVALARENERLQKELQALQRQM